MSKGISLSEFGGQGLAQEEQAAVRERQARRDLMMLEQLVAEPELSEYEFDAFRDMLRRLREGVARGLTERQRRWVQDVCEKAGLPTELPEERKPIPRGKEVPIAPVLRDLPKRPPARR